MIKLKLNILTIRFLNEKQNLLPTLTLVNMIAYRGTRCNHVYLVNDYVDLRVVT